MAIEIPNFFEAAGIFDGFAVPITPNPILAQNGIQPFNPATTNADPVGGFTRLAVNNYLIRLTRAIDILESICLVTCFPTLDKSAVLCASIIAGPALDPRFEDDGDVFVLGDPFGDENFFQFGIFRFLSDLAGTQGAPPTP